MLAVVIAAIVEYRELRKKHSHLNKEDDCPHKVKKLTIKMEEKIFNGCHHEPAG